MRLIKAIIAVIAVVLVFGNVNADTVESNDISSYYGFGEMEIIKLDWDISNLRIADFDGDGKNDIAIVNNRKSSIELLIQKESVGSDEKTVSVSAEDMDINNIFENVPTRFKKESIAVSQRIYSLVCGDLNGDGMTDLAFYGEPRGLYVMLQKKAESETGRPKILNWRTKKKIKIDDALLTPGAMVCADLNNDGKSDLAIASRDAVYIVLQKADGSLAEPVKYPAAAQILGIEVGDLNGDGINDLVLVTNDSEKPLHVRFGLKTGQLGPEVQFSLEKPWALELANIDGKAGDEILTVDSVSGRLNCYKFTTENQKDADWPILFYPLAAGDENTKRDLVIGDFNGDGLPDVVISEPDAAELIFYKQAPGIGLTEPVKFPAFSGIESMSAADIDGDGKTELAVLSVSEKVIGLSRLENDRLSFPKPVNLTGEPLAMELADVYHDGSIDCVYISKDANDARSLRIIHNIAATEGLAHPDAAEQVGETIPAVKLNKLTANPDGLKVIDVDQDGLNDILIFVKYESPILVRQVRKGTFEVIDSPKAQASLIKDASMRSIAVVDVDKNGSEELLLAQNNFARSLVFAEGKNWSIIDQYNAKSTENKISAVAAFDIDGPNQPSKPAILLLDGQKEQLQILRASNDKTYRLEKELDVGKWDAAEHLKMLFAPLTGSSTKSILLFDGEKFALITPPTGGSNTQPRLEQLFSYETKIKDGVYGNLAVGDINFDGRPDIVMVDYKGNHIEILTLNPQGKPVPAMRFKIFEEKSYRDREGKGGGKISVEPRELKVADVTGDGKNDLVTVIHDRIIIYPQD